MSLSLLLRSLPACFFLLRCAAEIDGDRNEVDVETPIRRRLLDQLDQMAGGSQAAAPA